MSEHVKSEVADGVMTLTFQRPEKKNALSGAMYDALSNAVRQAEIDASVRVVLFQGEGDSFTAANPSQTVIERFRGGGRIHQFLWRGSRPAGTREKGTERRGTMRNRSESSQVAQESFGPGRIAVTQRVSGCYCASARTGDSGGLLKTVVSQRKDAERRDKVSARTGKDTRPRQDP